MKFQFIRDDRLPRLAWAAIFEKANPSVTVIHGAWVETGEQFFFEGAWASTFPVADFSDCTTVFGSGGKLSRDEVVICSASHTLSRLHVLKRKSSLIVSNSFVFCLTVSGAKLKPGYALYFRDFHSISRGLEKCKKRIPLAEDTVDIIYFDNIAIRADLSTRRIGKPWPASFANYGDYYDFLLIGVRSLVENAASPQRRVRYDPLVSVSSGYDSTAAAVLASRVDCTDAITFPETRIPEVCDSGSPVAARLGLRVSEVDRLGYRELTNYLEADFIATGTAAHAGDVIFASLGKRLEGRILFTGFNGDRIWDLAKCSSRSMARISPSGSALEEFRLRIGFVHLPVPFIGALRSPEIHAISRSAEMRPWVIEGDYNRPIPRRIAEEVGVPRELFGQRKKAAGSRMFDRALRGPGDLEPLLSPAAYRDYSDYFRDNYRRNHYEIYYETLRLAGGALFRLSNLFNKTIARRLGVREWHPRALGQYAPKIGTNWLAFFWGAEKTSSRYRTGRVREIAQRLGSGGD